MTDRVQKAFSEYVRQGNGLLAIHSGTTEYIVLVGSQVSPGCLMQGVNDD